MQQRQSLRVQLEQAVLKNDDLEISKLKQKLREYTDIETKQEAMVKEAELEKYMNMFKRKTGSVKELQ